MKLKNIFLCIAIVCSQSVSALTLSQAKKLYKNGEFEKALPTFQNLVDKNPKNANYNQWTGACLYETGQKDEAVKYLEFALSRKIPDAARYLAQIALEKMDYEQAYKLTQQFGEMTGHDTSELSETAQKGYDRLKRVLDMLNNVEKIEVFDSLVVDKEKFFTHYRLTREAGTLNTPEVLPFPADSATTVVFMPQSKSRMMWASPDSVGTMKLNEIYKLADGKWDHSIELSDDLNDGGDADYPFVMADGTTLYFAGNGESSIGGYDIFMTRKDFTSGEYLQPQNIGMPYNSPYDDYMLVIDEMIGIGWWATDRNQIPGKVTIYLFKKKDIRGNYDRTSPDIYSLAAIKSIKESWVDNNYADLRHLIDNIETETDKPKADFSFHIKNGVEYTRFDNFRSKEAENLMHKRMTLCNRFETQQQELKELRKKYAKASSAVQAKIAPDILGRENALLKDAEEIQKLDNDIRSIEQQLL